ncbi:MAG: hypothetical protein J6Z40_01945 [Oscillospiraceae bacterium]|nr:hypothetical protein [Oscillospiraceae bacterium]
MEMEIKKLGKIEFDIAAQCSHGESNTKKPYDCHTDCRVVKYINSSWLWNAVDRGKHYYCRTKTVWTCATTCLL